MGHQGQGIKRGGFSFSVLRKVFALFKQSLFYCSALLLCSCVLFEPKPVPEVVAAPVKVAVKAKPKPKPRPQVVAQPKVAIVLSSESEAFASLGQQLKASLKSNGVLYSLKGDVSRGASVLKQIESQKHKQVVAVGLLAAQMASTLKNTQVIFCKVFNYRDNDLIRPWMKGVSMMPPADKVFAAWKAIDPGLQEVSIVTGLDQSEFIASVRLAAKKQGISLTHKVVRNDNEFSFASKALQSNAQWLVPDNRVLSRSALLDVMNHGVKRGRQIFAFDPDLLKLGALASVQAVDKDIAKQVMSKLRFSKGKVQLFGKNIAPVHKLDLKISAKTLERLDLAVPKKYKTAVQ